MHNYHGLTGTPEYDAWRQMIYRCTHPNHPGYRNYGARGIIVYEPWLKDPHAFIEHVGPRPSDRHSIDRVDNDRGYEPGNVKWSTRNQQAINRRPKPGQKPGMPGVKIYSATGLWGVITPRHPKTKKFKWLGRKFNTELEGVLARKEWLKNNWPTYPEGDPVTDW